VETVTACTYCREPAETVRPNDGACPRCVPLITAAGVFGREGLEHALKLRALLDEAAATVRQAAAEANVPPNVPGPVHLRHIDGRPMQCKDIPDAAFVDAVRATGRPDSGWAMFWDVWEELEKTVGPVPRNLFFAKARRLVDRGLIGGCPCGCRGDFHVPENCIDPAHCCYPTPALTVVSG
jgi:hypothetical protein